MKKIYREELISLHHQCFIKLRLHYIKQEIEVLHLPHVQFDDIHIEGVWSKTLNGEQFVFNN